MHPFVVAHGQQAAEQQRHADLDIARDRVEDAAEQAGHRHHEPHRQEQQVESGRIDVVVVMQAVLEAAHEADPRRLGVEQEPVRRVLIHEEHAGADQNRDRRKGDGPGNEGASQGQQR
jgi:hypothetical protein